MLRTVLSVAALGSLLARSDAYVRPAQSARLRTGAPPGRGQHPSTMFAEPIPAPEALEQTAETEYPLWPALPIAPYGTRKTVIREAIPGRMWLFEQRQGILYVQVSVRMTVIRLDSGGLLVYSPVAATKEVVDAMSEVWCLHVLVLEGSAKAAPAQQKANVHAARMQNLAKENASIRLEEAQLLREAANICAGKPGLRQPTSGSWRTRPRRRRPAASTCRPT